ncbi:hypothetical protein GC197_09650 [bacterium]|nr:hypothetical protein [bacterium]
MASNNPPSSDSSDSDSLGSTTRSILSLVLFIYLFVMWVVVSSSLGGNHASLAQDKLLPLFQPLTETLNLDVRASPYNLYSGNPEDYEHFFRIELTNPAGQVQTYQVPGPMLGSGLKDPYRYERLAKIVAMQAEISEDRIPAEICMGIGEYFLRQAGGGKVSLQCIRRRPQPMQLDIDGQQYSPDPRDASYEDIKYRATVLVDSEGAFQLIKQMADEHVAPVE